MRFPRTARLATAALAAGALLALAGCSAGSEPAPVESTDAAATGIEIPGATPEAVVRLNELYDSVRASGDTEITLYNAGASTLAPLLAVFEERFPGVTLDLVTKTDAEILTTLQTEEGTGRRVADVWWGGDSPAAAREENICRPVEVVTAPAGWEVPTAYDGKLTYFAHRMFGFIYNTDLVTPEDAPTSWFDLIEPEWHGKVAIGNPNSGALRHMLTGMMRTDEGGRADEFGTDFVGALAASDLQYVDPERNVAPEVASGRFPVGAAVFLGYFLEQQKLGAPVGFVFPLEDGGNFLTRLGLCAIQDSPAADATDLLVNWLYTEEAQKAFAEIDLSYSMVPGAPGPLGMPPLDDVERLPWSSQDPAINDPHFAFIEKTFVNPNAR